MKRSICGIDCEKCGLKDNCAGCLETGGKPFGGACIVADCAKTHEHSDCKACKANGCELRKQLLNEIHSLPIKNVERFTELLALSGAFINLPYTVPNGETYKFLDDKQVYLGAQVELENGRCMGVSANKECIVLSEYGKDGTDGELLMYKKR